MALVACHSIPFTTIITLVPVNQFFGLGGIEYEVVPQLEQQRLLMAKTMTSCQNDVGAQVYEAEGQQEKP